MNKKYVIDFDLDDSGYRNKLANLMNDTEKISSKFGVGGEGRVSGSGSNRISYERMRADEAQKIFSSQYSKERVARAQANVSYDENRNPFNSKQPPMSSNEDREIIRQQELLRQLNKQLDEGNKYERVIKQAERTRHEEYKSLTNKQLDVEKRKIEKDIKHSEDPETISAKRRDIQAINRAKRLNSDEEPSASSVMSKFGSLHFGQMAMNGMMSGRAGDTFGNVVHGGVNAASTMSMAGGGIGSSMLAGGAVAGILALFKSFGMGEEIARGHLMQSRTISNQNNLTNQYDPKNDSFQKMGLTEGDYVKKVEAFIQSSQYTGKNSNIGQEVLMQQASERSLGLSDQDYAGWYRTGGYGNDHMNAGKSSLGVAQYLESIGAGGIKVGLDKNGKPTEDRNLVTLGEYMKKLVDINESIYKITGEKSEKSQKDALKMFGSVLNLGGIFKRSDVASETALGIQESYRNPASPMAQFMNIQAFRQVNGNVGLHDMQLGMDNMTDPRVVNQSVKNLRAMYHLPENGSLEGVDQGQKWQYLNTLKNWKGIGSYTKASEFDKQYGMGGFKEGQLSKFVDKAPEEILLTASQNFATENEKLSTQLVSGFEQFGKSVQEFANAVTAFVNKFSFGDTPKPAGFSKNLPPVMLRSGGAKDIGDGSSANNYIQTSS